MQSFKMGDLTPEILRPVRVELLNKLRELDSFCGGRLRIHRLFSNSNQSSQHYHGKAADCHIEGLSVIDMYVTAERFNPGGLGLYGPDVWTRTPGLHFDIRDSYPAAKWGCVLKDGRQKYVALDKGFFKRLIQLEEG